jgi:hypothetical protein
MPIAYGKNREHLPSGRSHVAIQQRDDLVGMWHFEAPAGQKVVLNIGHDERVAFTEKGH